MMEIITFENIINLVMLIFLQAVLGFDNLLYISIESKRAPEQYQKSVRFWGIIIAVSLRIVLLFLMILLLDVLSEPFYIFNQIGIIEGGINFSSCIFFFGGIFIMYTAVKEIKHLLSTEHLGENNENDRQKTAFATVFSIVLMNLVFSFDSILSAIAITKVLALLIIAILISGMAMIFLADSVAEFLEKNRMYEVLGLFILLIVGIVLIGESGVAAAHASDNKELALKFFGYYLTPMSKTTFYFSVIVLFLVEILQTIYKRKINKSKH